MWSQLAAQDQNVKQGNLLCMNLWILSVLTECSKRPVPLSTIKSSSLLSNANTACWRDKTEFPMTTRHMLWDVSEGELSKSGRKTSYRYHSRCWGTAGVNIRDLWNLLKLSCYSQLELSQCSQALMLVLYSFLAMPVIISDLCTNCSRLGGLDLESLESHIARMAIAQPHSSSALPAHALLAFNSSTIDKTNKQSLEHLLYRLTKLKVGEHFALCQMFSWTMVFLDCHYPSRQQVPCFWIIQISAPLLGSPCVAATLSSTYSLEHIGLAQLGL